MDLTPKRPPPATASPTDAPTEILRTLGVLFTPGDVVELRVLVHPRRTDSGYFDDLDKLAECAAKLDGRSPVYVTLNATAPALLARAANRVEPYARSTTADQDIPRRKRFLIDFDPKRPTGISATDQEHAAALERCEECRACLLNLGAPVGALVSADSGNGAHLLAQIDLPNNDESRSLLERCLAAIAFRFNDPAVEVDLKTANAARVIKVYGTVACKGDDTPDRPHRRSRLLNADGFTATLDRGLLERVAGFVPEVPGASEHRPDGGFDGRRWVQEHAAVLSIAREGPWNGDGYRWILNPCPWNSSHTNDAAYIVQLPGGAIAAGCHHNGCAGKGWHELRDVVEPEWRQRPPGAPVLIPEVLPPTGPLGDDDGRKSQSTVMVDLVLESGAALFHTPGREVFATVPVGGHRETWKLKTQGFRWWLSGLYYRRTKKAPGAQAVQDAITVFSSKALFDDPSRDGHGAEHPVFVRVAEVDGVIYLDLVNAEWEVVEITPWGWRVVPAPPSVKFYRMRGMLPLPHPQKGGSIKELHKYVNVAGDADGSDFVMLVSALVAALRSTGPFPVLILQGEQGSAKSTTQRAIKKTIDPNSAPLRSKPREERDLMIAARNGWFIAFDNLSHLRQELSDSICRLATGGGFGTRELYTDEDEVLFDAMRPVMFNGINNPATKGDILDRAVINTAPMIADEKRRDEKELWAEFDAAHPRILGALLDGVSTALRNLPKLKLRKLPRMADFALWAAAAAPAFGWRPQTFLDAYAANRGEANTTALEAYPISEHLGALARGTEGGWRGTATQLLEALDRLGSEKVKREKDWPKSPDALGRQLTRLAPNLRAAGVAVGRDKTKGSGSAKVITIRETLEKSDASDASDATLDIGPSAAAPRTDAGSDAEPAATDAKAARTDAESAETPTKIRSSDSSDTSVAFPPDFSDGIDADAAAQYKPRRTGKVIL